MDQGSAMKYSPWDAEKSRNTMTNIMAREDVMEDHELEAVSLGVRTFTAEERQWALNQHSFLSEYVRHTNPEALSDDVLAADVLWADQEYVRCTM